MGNSDACRSGRPNVRVSKSSQFENALASIFIVFGESKNITETKFEQPEKELECNISIVDGIVIDSMLTHDLKASDFIYETFGANSILMKDKHSEKTNPDDRKLVLVILIFLT